LLRADTAVYGYDVGYGQVDESWGADPLSITDGLEPALQERLWSQLHLTSTAHVKATSLMRRRLTAALRDADPDVLLLFWGAPPNADLSLESTWRAASPHWTADRLALIRRKYAAALAGQDEPEFDDPDPIRGWASQYLNVWPLLLAGSGNESVMPTWALCSTSRTPPPPKALGISVDLDRVWVCVGAYGEQDERRHLGAVMRKRLDSDRGAVIAEVKRIQSDHDVAVVIDRKDQAESLGEDLELAGVTVTWVGLEDYITSCSDLYDAVAAKEVEHGDYPELNDAVASARKRKVNQRWVWSDAPMLKAVTLAFGCEDANASVYSERDMVVL
jgi:hypothetical protein